MLNLKINHHAKFQISSRIRKATILEHFCSGILLVLEIFTQNVGYV